MCNSKSALNFCIVDTIYKKRWFSLKKFQRKSPLPIIFTEINVFTIPFSGN